MPFIMNIIVFINIVYNTRTIHIKMKFFLSINSSLNYFVEVGKNFIKKKLLTKIFYVIYKPLNKLFYTLNYKK